MGIKEEKIFEKEKVNDSVKGCGEGRGLGWEGVIGFDDK